MLTLSVVGVTLFNVRLSVGFPLFGRASLQNHRVAELETLGVVVMGGPDARVDLASSSSVSFIVDHLLEVVQFLLLRLFDRVQARHHLLKLVNHIPQRT